MIGLYFTLSSSFGCVNVFICPILYTNNLKILNYVLLPGWFYCWQTNGLIHHHPEEVLDASKGKSHTPFPFCDVSHRKPLTLLSSLSCTHSPLSTSSHSMSNVCICQRADVCMCDVKMILRLSQCWTRRVLTLVSRRCLFTSMNLTALIALLLACSSCLCGLWLSHVLFTVDSSLHASKST